MSAGGGDSYAWTIDINVPGSPIEKANELLKQMLDNLEKSRTFAEKLKQAFANELVGSFADAVKSLPGIFASAVSGVTNLVSGFAKLTIEAASMREQAIGGFEAMYGGADTAREIFADVLKIAKATKFETAEVVDRFNSLAAAGFKRNELNPVFAATADIASARTSRQGDLFQNNLERIKNLGFATLGTFQGAIRAGAGREGWTELGKLTGIVDPSAKEVTSKQIDQIRKALSNKDSKIDADTAITALLNAVREKYDHESGNLGDYARKKGIDSLAGLLSNLKDSLQDTIAGLPLEKFTEVVENGQKKKVFEMPNFASFKTFLQDVNGFLMQDEETSARFQNLIKNLVEDVFSLFNIGEVDGQSGTKAFLTKVLEGAEALEKQVKKFFFWIRDTVVPGILDTVTNPEGIWVGIKTTLMSIARQVGGAIFEGAKEGLNNTIGEPVNDVGEFVFGKSLWNALNGEDKPQKPEWLPSDTKTGASFGGSWSDDGEEVGGSWGAGVVKGINDSKESVQKASADMGLAADEAVRAATETHSPSRKFMKIGAELANGLKIGMSAGLEGLGDSVSTSIDRQTYNSVNRHSDSGDIIININSSESASAIANEVARTLKELGRFSYSPSVGVV